MCKSQPDVIELTKLFFNLLNMLILGSFACNVECLSAILVVSGFELDKEAPKNEINNQVNFDLWEQHLLVGGAFCLGFANGKLCTSWSLVGWGSQLVYWCNGVIGALDSWFEFRGLDGHQRPVYIVQPNYDLT